MSPKDAEGMTNSADPDQTSPLQSHLGLHCLPKPICLKNLGLLRYVKCD